MTKTGMSKLKKSQFFYEVCDIVMSWDHYLKIGNQEMADIMMSKWVIAKLALEYITGNVYRFSRNGIMYSIVNEHDYDDRLIIGKSNCLPVDVIENFERKGEPT